MESKYRITEIVENEARWADRQSRVNNLVDIHESLEKIQEKYPFCKSKGGIPLSYENDTIYVDASDSHTLIIGATGSKKTRLIVMPTVKMLEYANESMIITDPKGEVFDRTAYGLKKDGYDLHVINFRNPSTGDCWNPLDIPFQFYKKGEIDRAREYANDVATNLALSNVSSKDPYWDESAYNLLYGLILLAFLICKENDTVSMKDVLQLRESIFPSKSAVVEEYVKIAQKDAIVYRAILGTVTAPDDTRACILSEFDRKVSCFSYQKDLSDMMDNSTINIGNIGAQKSAIFLIMPDEKTIYHKLVTLFIKQSYEYLIYRAYISTDFTIKHRINYLLDEFSNLPCINDFPAMISAARSRNIRFDLIIQSIKQLYSKYGENADVIRGNCNNLVYLYSRELSTLEEIRDLCGKKADNKYLVTTTALQHFDKDKGECLVLSGRLFPFITRLKDISFFDDDKYERIQLAARTLESVSRKNIRDYIEKKRPIKHLVSSGKTDDEKQGNTKAVEERNTIHSMALEYFSLVTMFVLCAILLILCYFNKETHIAILIGLFVLCVILTLMEYSISIRDMLKISIAKTTIFCVVAPVFIIEIIRVLLFTKNIYNIIFSLSVLQFWFVVIVSQYVEYKYLSTAHSKLYDVVSLLIGTISGGLLIGYSLMQQSWNTDICTLIIIGFVIIYIVYHFILLLQSKKNIDFKNVDWWINICTYDIYILLSVSIIFIRSFHNINNLI